MRILVTGASGMLGATLVDFLTKNHEVFGTGNSNFENSKAEYMKFDLTNDSYADLMEWAQPDMVIHSGALTNGNYCNSEPLEAFNVNGIAIKKILDATEIDVRIIYISTDAVFPSNKSMAKETDCVRPESVYGKSKELGEFFLLNSDRRYTIVRTTIVGLNLNQSKSGFVEWILNASLTGQEINLFNDVLFTPISIWHLTEEIEYLISNNEINSEILHVAGNQNCTKYEFGKALLDEFEWAFDKVNKGSIANFKDRAKRSLDQSLNCAYYQNTYNRELPTLKETVATIKKHYNEQY